MAISKHDEEKIKQAVYQSVNLISKEMRDAPKDKYKQTEKRLYAYLVLKRNIERYKLDIEDIKQEDMKKSKDFVLFTKNLGNGIEKPDIEQLRAAKILMIQQKIARDEKEIAEIDAAIEEIKDDEYYQIIQLRYFEGKEIITIAENLHCGISTIGRNRTKLIHKIALTLYGADAL